ncbi:hypothetical protein TWF569_003538 [Orbilia oligospora]|uniref:Actin-like ATPase domain-containing protein n=1 Tax=Orbilia oligospora TaxID=2813651 RepID=A0A7C8JPC7_ORBOL|nr:hypothetical protein TWF706_007827 [Orbilia oligospora]KAF3105864.1 hypothetical protein TWF102_001770 [Orbilia oligospora]KAF3112525.1 hypothetical protein TWF103_002776 [Orbilia oligospora]KAF3129971.1 hypothetical protein TWF594_010549 [Orbilia oligospora]KAF3151824.1 hypothetical protein TWF569_003538 [Orbilia oligospora]
MYASQQAGNPAFNQYQQPQTQATPISPQWSGQSQPGYQQPINQGPANYANPYDQKVPFPPQPAAPPNLQLQQQPPQQQFQQQQFQAQAHPQFSPQNTGFHQHQQFQHAPQQQAPPFGMGVPPIQQYHPQGNPAFMQNAAPQAGQTFQVQNFAGPAPGAQYGRHKIIVALDFGTTYSGLAFADTTPGEPQISIIQNWPNCGTRALSQVPTEIAYPTTGGQFSWGYDIQPTLSILKWFKLFLEYPDEEIAGLCDLPSGKTIEDVVADFLSAVYQHAIAQLHVQRGKAVMDITQVDFVLTIPAVWNEQACARTKRAAERAGFATNHTLNMCTEPEAAALYTLRSSETSANVGDKIIVCDAGGGTVDLISYNIRRIHPRLEVDEAVVGSGDTCGSTYIDQSFEDFFKTRMGAHYDSLRVAQRQRVMRNFEEVKCGFRDREDQDTYSVIVPGRDNIPEARVVDGEFEITRAEMRSLFDPVIDKVIELIAEQVRQIAHVDKTASNRQILLVGGFGQSPYLYNRVVAWAKPQGINVLQPKDGDVAVVKGGVIRGIDLSAPQQVGSIGDPTRAMWIRKCRKHYGTLMIAHFIPGQHLEEDAFFDPLTGLKMARNQISWFVYKGAEISDDKKISQQFHRTFRKTTPWVDTIVVCEDDFPPMRMTPRVKVLCKLTADLTNQSKRIFDVEYGFMKKIFTCAYRVDMTLRAGYMTFELVYKGISYGAVSVELQ